MFFILRLDTDNAGKERTKLEQWEIKHRQFFAWIYLVLKGRETG